MASITNRPAAAGNSATSVITDLFGRIAAWNDARITRAALNKLSDHELNDLGLVRGDIDAIAEGRMTR